MRAYRVLGISMLGLMCAGAACVRGAADESTTPTSPPGAGGGGSDGGTPSCVPSEAVGTVPDACGVFVSSSMGSDTTGRGTQTAPYQTLTKALAEADEKAVYACGESFTEALSIAGSATLYGALDCGSGWTYDANAKTQLTAGPGVIPLPIGGPATTVELADFAITSASATEPGGSSIAVLVVGVAASLTRCDIVAGDGMAGAPGAASPMPAQAGELGEPGAAACSGELFSQSGGVVSAACGDGDSFGGSGGNGTAVGGNVGRWARDR